MTDIIREADVSISTFQNIFRSKDGVLLDLTEEMFSNQYDLAQQVAGKDASPVLLFAIETSIQLTLTELNDNLREIYVAAYSCDRSSECIFQNTAQKLYELFGLYQPECALSDFYEMEIGTAGIMRNYMTMKCNKYFTLSQKLENYLKLCLRAYCIPRSEIDAVIADIQNLNIKAISEQVMQELFTRLSVNHDFHLSSD